ncbi:sensor histidine kinase [uncultured Streptococcus sp.]|jgi:two-component system sensor histidine kinase DesK|uniref:sensor histidine kinase n=1 Tax=uncultured Streptococcus sp. TaxID=83427 RepID=UPI0025F75585|nr:sensor histidine kinase [uncultured Streptococcus sp.]
MWEKLKQVHYMFHIALVFIIFPVAGVISGEYPLFLLLWTAIFVVAYYAVLLSNHRLIQFFSWWFLVAYIYYCSVWLNGGFAWYVFYLSNMLIYELDDISFKSWRFLTFVALQPAILLTNYLLGHVGPAELLFFIVTFLFSDGMTFGLYRIQTAEQIKEEKVKQNAQLNLFLAENERNRIGRDLHDSLGHTFAMLSVKAELAQQFLQMEAYDKAAKELQEVQEISKKSMADVRRIINDLKNRTLDEELVTIRAMLEMSGVQVEMDNQLNVASVPPSQQSTISMILLEAATNIIKHAKAKKSNFSLVKKNEKLILDIQDDGCGFQKLTGRELHSIRERLSALSGKLEILSSQDPTWIRIELPYGGKEA